MSAPGNPALPVQGLRLGIMVAGSLVFLGFALTHGLSAGSASLTAGSGALVVTNPGDAGPGTLRDAILAADRLSSRARIVVSARRIVLDSVLPPLINPHGVDIEAVAGAGILEAGRQAAGAVLQINSPSATIKGLHIVKAHAWAFIINAPGVQLESVTVTDSNVGVLLHASGRGASILTSLFERNDTAVMAEPGVYDVTVGNSTFRGNTRAGVWFVGAAGPPMASAGAQPQPPADRDRMRIVEDVFETNAAGVVLANQPTLVHKSRFSGNRQSAVLVLGGAARVEGSEIRNCGGNAISVLQGRSVVLAHNTLIDNPAIAILARDSAVTIADNILQHNGYGIVSISGDASIAAVLRDNVITGSVTDAITVIGGAPTLLRNQLIENHAAGVRTLDFVQAHGTSKAAPVLEANVFRHNGVDTPGRGVYELSGVR